MKVAIAQMPMGWTAEENTRTILDHLAEARRLGADVAVFPECATTGFHRQVPGRTTAGVVRRAVAQIQDRCRALGLPAVVGTPWFPAEEEPPVWNAAAVIGAGGELLSVCPKVGLTQSEHGWFHPGTERPAFTLGSVRCAVLLCREVRDAEAARASLAGVRVVFWPGAIAWNDTALAHPESVVTREIAVACARRLDVHLVQCNWPGSLNDPAKRGMGGSLVVSPAGEIVHECPADEPGVSVVTLDLAAEPRVDDRAAA